MISLVRWSVRSPVAANVLMLLMFFGGALALMSMRRELFPDMELDFIVIAVPYPGASPEEVEEGICVKIEEKIDGVDGLKKITSTASEGRGQVIAELIEDADLQDVYNDIKNEIDQIFTFPLEAEEPIISTIVRREPAIFLAVHGDAPERVLRNIAEDVRDELEATTMVTQANLSGARNFEISIEISEEALRRYGLSFDDVGRAIERASLDLPAGKIKTPDAEVLVRAKGQRYTGREFEDIPLIALPGGAMIRLGQVATIIDGFEDSDIHARFASESSEYVTHPAIVIQVMKTSTQDVIDVVDAVREYVAQKAPQLPEGIGLTPYFDSSKMVKDRINLLRKNGLQGLALVFLALWFFLRFRLAFWVAMGIPISFMGGFWILGSVGATINMISLFAFIMTLGIVVDDAIIIGENIYSHYRRGASPYRAAIDGAAEVGWPVANSVMTTIVAFCPLYFVTGVMGKFMVIMPTAVISVLVVSLLEAFLILPAHLKQSMENAENKKGRDANKSRMRAKIDNGVERFIARIYIPFLHAAVRNRYMAFALSIAVALTCFGFVGSGRIPYVMFPKIDQDFITATVEMPHGTPVEKTERAVKKLEESMLRVMEKLAPRVPEGKRLVNSMAINIGQKMNFEMGPNMGAAGGSTAQFLVEFLPTEERNIPASEILALWREETGEIPGVERLKFEMIQTGPGGNPIEIRLMGDDLPDVVAAAEELKGELATFPGVFDINDDFDPGKWEMKIKAKPAAKNLGLTLGDIARQVRQGFYGHETMRIQRGRDEVKVMVRYPESDRRARSDVESMRIRTAARNEVPFSEVAEVEYGRGYSTIKRIDRKRAITVTADIDEAEANAQQIVDHLAAGFLIDLTRRHRGVFFDLEGQARETADSMASLMHGYAFALVGIFCLLAAQFRSYIQPIIIMFAIPLALVGAIWGHWVMGMDLSMISMFGMVALSGVVVNDSLVMIDFINRAIAAGATPHEAVMRSGEGRFRAIILTSATTVAGLAPLLLERSMQARFLMPMAVSLAFGLIAATVLTLVITPCLYLIVADVKKVFGFRAATALPLEEEM